MIKYLQKTNKNNTLNALDNFEPNVWIYAENPSEEELIKITKGTRIDVSYIRDALDPFEVPRFEKDRNLYYLFFRTPDVISNNISTCPVLFIIGKDFFVSVCPKNLAIFDKFLENSVNFNTTNPTNLFIQLFSEIRLSYYNSLISINRSIYQSSANIERIKNKDIAAFVSFEQTCNNYLSRLIQNSAVLNSLLSKEVIKISEEEKEEINDLYLANNQLIDMSKNSLHSVKNIKDAYSTILTNNLNRVIRLLTIFTIILSIPTVISGLWGMNLNVPFNELSYAFWIIVGIIVIICSALIYLFTKADWM